MKIKMPIAKSPGSLLSNNPPVLVWALIVVQLFLTSLTGAYAASGDTDPYTDPYSATVFDSEDAASVTVKNDKRTYDFGMPGTLHRDLDTDECGGYRTLILDKDKFPAADFYEGEIEIKRFDLSLPYSTYEGNAELAFQNGIDIEYQSFDFHDDDLSARFIYQLSSGVTTSDLPSGVTSVKLTKDGYICDDYMGPRTQLSLTPIPEEHILDLNGSTYNDIENGIIRIEQTAGENIVMDLNIVYVPDSQTNAELKVSVGRLVDGMAIPLESHETGGVDPVQKFILEGRGAGQTGQARISTQRIPLRAGTNIIEIDTFQNDNYSLERAYLSNRRQTDDKTLTWDFYEDFYTRYKLKIHSPDSDPTDKAISFAYKNAGEALHWPAHDIGNPYQFVSRPLEFTRTNEATVSVISRNTPVDYSSLELEQIQLERLLSTDSKNVEQTNFPEDRGQGYTPYRYFHKMSPHQRVCWWVFCWNVLGSSHIEWEYEVSSDELVELNFTYAPRRNDLSTKLYINDELIDDNFIFNQTDHPFPFDYATEHYALYLAEKLVQLRPGTNRIRLVNTGSDELFVEDLFINSVEKTAKLWDVENEGAHYNKLKINPNDTEVKGRSLSIQYNDGTKPLELPAYLPDDDNNLANHALEFTNGANRATVLLRTENELSDGSGGDDSIQLEKIPLGVGLEPRNRLNMGRYTARYENPAGSVNARTYHDYKYKSEGQYNEMTWTYAPDNPNESLYEINIRYLARSTDHEMSLFINDELVDDQFTFYKANHSTSNNYHGQYIAEKIVKLSEGENRIKLRSNGTTGLLVATNGMHIRAVEKSKENILELSLTQVNNDIISVFNDSMLNYQITELLHSNHKDYFIDIVHSVNNVRGLVQATQGQRSNLRIFLKMAGTKTLRRAMPYVVSTMQNILELQSIYSDFIDWIKEDYQLPSQIIFDEYPFGVEEDGEGLDEDDFTLPCSITDADGTMTIFVAITRTVGTACDVQAEGAAAGQIRNARRQGRRTDENYQLNLIYKDYKTGDEEDISDYRVDQPDETDGSVSGQHRRPKFIIRKSDEAIIEFTVIVQDGRPRMEDYYARVYTGPSDEAYYIQLQPTRSTPTSITYTSRGSRIRVSHENHMLHQHDVQLELKEEHDLVAKVYRGKLPAGNFFAGHNTPPGSMPTAEISKRIDRAEYSTSGLWPMTDHLNINSFDHDPITGTTFRADPPFTSTHFPLYGVLHNVMSSDLFNNDNNGFYGYYTTLDNPITAPEGSWLNDNMRRLATHKLDQEKDSFKSVFKNTRSLLRYAIAPKRPSQSDLLIVHSKTHPDGGLYNYLGEQLLDTTDWDSVFSSDAPQVWKSDMDWLYLTGCNALRRGSSSEAHWMALLKRYKYHLHGIINACVNEKQYTEEVISDSVITDGFANYVNGKWISDSFMDANHPDSPIKKAIGYHGAHRDKVNKNADIDFNKIVKLTNYNQTINPVGDGLTGILQPDVPLPENLVVNPNIIPQLDTRVTFKSYLEVEERNFPFPEHISMLMLNDAYSIWGDSENRITLFDKSEDYNRSPTTAGQSKVWADRFIYYYIDDIFADSGQTNPVLKFMYSRPHSHTIINDDGTVESRAIDGHTRSYIIRSYLDSEPGNYYILDGNYLILQTNRAGVISATLNYKYGLKPLQPGRDYIAPAVKYMIHREDSIGVNWTNVKSRLGIPAGVNYEVNHIEFKYIKHPDVEYLRFIPIWRFVIKYDVDSDGFVETNDVYINANDNSIHKISDVRSAVLSDNPSVLYDE